VAIHPTAVIDPDAVIGADVEIGPYAVVGAGVVLADRVRIGSHVVLEGPCALDADVQVHAFAALGGAPQDRKYRGEAGLLRVGARTVVREHVTMHRGTSAGGGVTAVGADGLFMAGSHVAHDARVGDGVVFANGAAVAGHVVVGDGAVLGGLSGVHQHARVGRCAMIAAGAMVASDVPPFLLAQGDRARLRGLNRVGLRRAGVSPEAVRALTAAVQVLFCSTQPRVERIAEARAAGGHVAEVVELLAFLEGGTRGVCRWGRADDPDAA
jgi:UDP-N-acetylglucosamine acyltransferase